MRISVVISRWHSSARDPGCRRPRHRTLHFGSSRSARIRTTTSCVWREPRPSGRRSGIRSSSSRSPTATSGTGARPAGRWRAGTAESQETARMLGITTQVLDIHDGELEPTLEIGAP